jgi:hypothetical protein
MNDADILLCSKREQNLLLKIVSSMIAMIIGFSISLSASSFQRLVDVSNCFFIIVISYAAMGTSEVSSYLPISAAIVSQSFLFACD